MNSKVKIFSITFGLFYFAFFSSLWSPFRYYPAIGSFSLSVLPPDVAGPPILWYGWVTASFVCSAVLALIVPRSLTDRLWHGYTWLIPLLTVLAIFYHEKRWFPMFQ